MRVETEEKALEALRGFDVECPYCAGEREYLYEDPQYERMVRWCEAGHILAEVRTG